MDLKEFIAQALVQIAEGVGDAQEGLAKQGGVANPHLSTGVETAQKHGFLIASGAYATVVQFDVALTVTEGTGTKGGLGIFAGAVNLGTSGQSQSESSSVSRLKFNVPLLLKRGSN